MEPHVARSVIEVRLREHLLELARSEEAAADCAEVWLTAMPHAAHANLARQFIDKLDFRGPAHALGWVGGRVVMTVDAEHDWWVVLAGVARDEAYRDVGPAGLAPAF